MANVAGMAVSTPCLSLSLVFFAWARCRSVQGSMLGQVRVKTWPGLITFKKWGMLHLFQCLIFS
jgi:hypothetical protein